MTDNFANSQLYKRILSEENIYNSIFCLESYIFEQGLLDTSLPVSDEQGKIIAENDLKLYYALADKYNVDLISQVIEVCRNSLELLFSDSKNLFTFFLF